MQLIQDKKRLLLIQICALTCGLTLKACLSSAAQALALSSGKAASSEGGLLALQGQESDVAVQVGVLYSVVVFLLLLRTVCLSLRWSVELPRGGCGSLTGGL